MATQVQFRGGTTTAHGSFTGAAREVTVDTDKDTVVIHDGSTAGGFPLLREDGSNSALALGSQGTPSLKFTGDTNTGIYSPGADQVAISTGGTGRLFIDASGRVLMGTTTEGEETADNLTIASNSHTGITIRSGTSSEGNIFFSDGTSGSDELRGAVRYYHSNNSLTFTSDATERLRIDSSGKVGIGTSSPQTTLHLSASNPQIRLQDSDGTNQYAQVYNSAGTSTFFSRNNTSYGPISFVQYNGTSSVAALYIDSSQRVGIGTTSPSYNLQIKADSPTLAFQPTTNTQEHRILFRNAADNATPGSIVYDHSADSLLFRVNASERFRCDGSGRLLVGTTTAYGEYVGASSGYFGTLQIARNAFDGVAQFSNWTSNTDLDSNGGTQLFISRCKSGTVGSHTSGALSSGNPIGRLIFNTSDGTNFRSSAYITAEVDGAVSTADVPGRLVFSTTADGASSPTERMRIHSGGILTCQGVYDTTTASGANVNVSASGNLARSTSSVKYKTSVETIQDSYSDALLQCRPVWYRSTCESDNPDYGYWGFIAEEVAEIDPRLVFWKTTEPVRQENGSLEHVSCDPEPEGVAYERFVPHLLNLIKRQQQAIETLEAKVAALEAN